MKTVAASIKDSLAEIVSIQERIVVVIMTIKIKSPKKPRRHKPLVEFRGICFNKVKVSDLIGALLCISSVFSIVAVLILRYLIGLLKLYAQ